MQRTAPRALETKGETGLLGGGGGAASNALGCHQSVEERMGEEEAFSPSQEFSGLEFARTFRGPTMGYGRE